MKSLPMENSSHPHRDSKVATLGSSTALSGSLILLAVLFYLNTYLHGFLYDDAFYAFKIAAIEKTIAYPLDPWFHLGDPRLVFALVFAVIGLSVQAFSRRDG